MIRIKTWYNAYMILHCSRFDKDFLLFMYKRINPCLFTYLSECHSFMVYFWPVHMNALTVKLTWIYKYNIIPFFYHHENLSSQFPFKSHLLYKGETRAFHDPFHLGINFFHSDMLYVLSTKICRNASLRKNVRTCTGRREMHA